MIVNNLIELIGNTPLVKLQKIIPKSGAEVYVKLEGMNPGGSVKDRAALGMIEAAEKTGTLRHGMKIVEPSSGNTGIALALIGRLKGYDVTIIMPDSMSKERRQLITAYGAHLELTPGSKGMQGTIDLALAMQEKDINIFIPYQFVNKHNPCKHYETTAEEILADLPNISAFVAGVGTGGTITGVGKRLKEENQEIQIIAVEPAESDVLSGGSPGPHKIQGIGAGFIPEIYRAKYVDDVLTVTTEDALAFTNQLVKEEGLFVGISAAANILATLRLAESYQAGQQLVTIAPDGGEKYLSMGIYE
jgi:cysteine synthase A